MTDMLQTASKYSAELVHGMLGAWATHIYTESQSLQSRVPNYEPYVITTFDKELIETQLLAHKWDTLAKAWGALSKKNSPWLNKHACGAP